LGTLASVDDDAGMSHEAESPFLLNPETLYEDPLG